MQQKQTTAPESGAAADIWELLLYGPAAKVQYCLALKKQVINDSQFLSGDCCTVRKRCKSAKYRNFRPSSIDTAETVKPLVISIIP